MVTHEPDLWTDDFFDSIRPAVSATGLHRADHDWISPAQHIVQTDYDIWYVSNGAGSVRVNDSWHAFTAGDLITIQPGQVYQQERTDPSAPFEIYFTHVLPFGRREPRCEAALSRIWPLRMSMLHRPEFGEAFRRLFEVYTTRRSGQSLALQGWALLLLDTIFDELRGVPMESPPKAWRNLLSAREYMEENYAWPLTLAEIAEDSRISVSHLSALFTRHLGCPPVEYLIRVRIREAKLLLARGERVKEVAERTGFSSQQYFSRQFRMRTGLTPSEFISRHARMPGGGQ